MSRILVHTACPDAKRSIAADMAHLSGDPREHIVECSTVPGGPSALWDASKGYSGKWWAASQALDPQIAQDMLGSGYALGTESWFVALYETGGTLIQHNLPAAPANSTFDAFLSAAGLVKVISGGPLG